MAQQQPTVQSGNVPFVRFSTADLPVGDAYPIWRETVSVIFEPTIDADDEEPFRAAVDTFHLGDMLFCETSVARQRFARTRRMIRRDGMDHFLIQVYHKGGYRGDVDGESIDLRPGEVSILDFAKPLATQADSSDTLSLIVPRSMLERLLATDRLHGRVLRGTAAALFSDYVFSLQRRLPSLLQEEAPLVTQSLTGLFAALMQPTNANIAPTVQEELALARAKRCVETLLHRPRLDTEEICMAAAISRGSLYRLFKPYGGISRYVLARRLARCRHALENPGHDRLIAEIAYAHGFVSEAHFSRAFRQAYGIAPRDARHDRRAAATTTVRRQQALVAEADFSNWIRRFQYETA
ncbi:MAG: helix-turn-helix domain-containing protein [Rudaea sp.]|uniref:helix-turn-helix domain-containing protein n=1 Tax=unclassified Rudaea TaxID=2627037 RepID=UPI0010F788F3|nr:MULTISPECIES: helix-turn-helix domain-containing protein [unclassified Rudaea]MBN8885109.1 helix-turn-helix domain-containing protein [Rudaea sp.]MBR0344788.1 helix-turn-helix domain-containing protein [Rudaea sp.]